MRQAITEGALLLALATAGWLFYARRAGCAVPSGTTLSRLESAIRRRRGLLPGAPLRLVGDGALPGSCVRRAVFASQGGGRFAALLSPDQRYAMAGAVDLTRLPARPPAFSPSSATISPPAPPALAPRAFAELLAGGPPSLGPADAPVTIVEFADFECPFCRRLSRAIATAGLRRGGVRIVFRQFPLAAHPWAWSAATLAACAARQSNAAFWALHDFLFTDQSEIDPGDLGRLAAPTLRAAGVNLAELRACADGPAGRGLVEADINLGRRAGVTGTPTLFINGEPVVGSRTAAELRSLLAAAKAAGKSEAP
jgi:protein-disulfide isomerase